MPIPEDIVRARLVFSLGDPAAIQEEAILGFHLRRVHQLANPTDWPTDTQVVAEKIRLKWIQHVQTGQFPPSTRLVRAEAYHLGTDGKTLDKGVSATRNESGQLWYGSSSNPSLPYEVSLAVSLYGYPPGGFTQQAARKRGRFYLPPMTTTAMATGANSGRFSATAQTAIREQMAFFLNDVHRMTARTSNVPDDDYYELGILSTAGSTFTRATHVRVGDVPDSQRRRRRSQAEVYQDAVLTDN